MEFELDKARAAGVSDEQIAGALAEKANFDLDKALAAGATHEQVIPFLMERLRPMQDLPQGVAPSDAGAGRGRITPRGPTLRERLFDPNVRPGAPIIQKDGPPTTTKMERRGGAEVRPFVATGRDTTAGDVAGAAGDALKGMAGMAGDVALDTASGMVSSEGSPYPEPDPLEGNRMGQPLAYPQTPIEATSGASIDPSAQPDYQARAAAPAEASPMPLGADLAARLRQTTTNPVARGAASGFAQLGQTGVGAVRLAADLFGADKVGDFASETNRNANQFGNAATVDLKGNDKLVADVTSSIMNSAPAMAVGTVGGPALRTLFGQTALAEYSNGRDAGFNTEESLKRAGIFGAAEAIGERFGFPEQIKLLKSLGKHIPTDQLSRAAGEMLAKEIPGEQLTTLIEFLADKAGPAALNPNATLSDYLDQAGETLKVTVAQTAVMGGGPAAIGVTGNAIRRADQTIANTRPVQVDPHELIAGAIDEAAAAYGLSPKAAAAMRDQAQVYQDPGQAAAYVARALDGLERRNLVKKPGAAAGFQQALAEKAQAAQEEAAAPAAAAPAPAEDFTGLEAAAPAAPAPRFDAAAILAGDTPAAAPAPAGPVEGEPINRNWSAFTPESGTLGIPREQMPQVKAEHRGALTNFLNARGVTHESGEVPADVLKPAQAEFSPKKVQQASEYQGGDRSILVSNDGFILDGTHQWAAKKAAGEPIKAIVFNAPIQDLLRLTQQFPSSYSAGGATRAGNGTGPAEPGRTEGAGPTVGSADRGTEPLVQGELQQPVPAGTAGGPVPASGASDVPGATGAGRGDDALSSKDRWLKAVSDHNRLAGHTGAQVDGLAPNGRINFAGDPNATKAGRALLGTVNEAIKAGATPAEVVAAATGKPSQPEMALTSGQPVTLDGKQYTVQKMGKAAVTLVDAAGKTRAIAKDSKHWPNIKPSVSANGRQAPAASGNGRVIAQVGTTPKTATPLELRENKDGTLTPWHDGHELLDFDSGDPVKLPAGATDEQALDAIKAAGSLGRHAKVFKQAESAAPQSSAAPTNQGEANGQVERQGRQGQEGLLNAAPSSSERGVQGGIGVPAPQPAKLTPEEAAKRFEWRDLGTKDGTKTHALFFSDPADSRSMRYGEVTVFKGSSRFQIDGGEPQLTLKAAKAEAERLALDRLRKDGYVEGKTAPEIKPPTEAIQDVGEKIGGARKDVAESGGTRSRKAATEDARPAWARRFKVSQIVKAAGRLDSPRDEGRWVIHDSRSTDFMGQPKQVGRQTFATKEEAEAFVPIAAVGLKHRAVMTRDGKYEIWRDVSDRKRVKVIDKVFDTRDEAMAYMVQHAAEIIETNTTFGEADMPLPPDRKRTGPERRKGDVKPDDFAKTFGFRGVEFGNWNNQVERQALMNDAWDGLMDLADVLNVPPLALGLNGDLALAFGARGHGLSSARAHYEPDRAVINLTKESGAGSLAHEWFHGLDHYFARQDGKAAATWQVQPDGTRTLKIIGDGGDMASSGFRGDRSGVRAELRAAYDKLLQTMFKKAETYVEDTSKADKFTARTKEELAQRLDSLRRDLAETARYGSRKAPATAEQLAEFDTIAKAMLDGDMATITTDWRTVQVNKTKAATRWTNDSLERLSAIYKEVRGRSGFDSTNRNGIFDSLRGYMERYSQRLKMLADAQVGAEKTRMVPTEFAMNAKELDQGRGTDYWTTPHEMAARAFQGYVEDKIAAQGGVSRFLNYGPENAGILTPWGFKRPFPAGQERVAINKAFDAFVGELKTQDTDKGVALLSRPSDVTNTAAFSRWFKESKVTDEDGAPLVVYHGTNKTEGGEAFSSFDTYGSEYGLFGQGGYFTADPDVASQYTKKGKGPSPTVYPVYLSIQNPIDMDAKADQKEWESAFQQADFEEFKPDGDSNEAYYRAVEEALIFDGVEKYEGQEIMQEGLRSMGYDGITHIGGGRVNADSKRHRVFIAFDPEQIKSATGNNGEFDPAKAAIALKRGNGSGLDITVARGVVAQLNDLGVRKVHVAATVQDMPPARRDAILAKDKNGEARGAYFPKEDEIWVVAKNLRNTDDMVFVVLHEAFHRGLQVTFGAEGGKLLRQIYATNKKVRDLADVNMRRFKIGQEEATNEALADLAGKGEVKGIRQWDRLLKMIRAWLGKIGDALGIKLNFTDDMVESLIAGLTRAGLQDQPAVNSGAPSLSVEPERAALNALSQDDALYQIPKSTKDTLEGIIGDIDPDIRMRRADLPNRETMWTLTMPSGAIARITQRPADTYGPPVYGYESSGVDFTPVLERPGDNAEAVPEHKGDVWVDVSQLEEGGDGRKVYAAAANYAYNTGRVFIGDPNGLSDIALHRRAQHMLSSALKFGTTEHIAPSMEQVKGSRRAGVPALQWTYGDDLGNIRSLANVILGETRDNPITFRPETGRFYDQAGRELDDDAIRSIAEAGSGGPARAGSSTLKRAAVLESLVRSESSSGRGQDGRPVGLLDRLLELSSEHPAATSRVFYSRSGDSGPLLSRHTPEQEIALAKAGVRGPISLKGKLQRYYSAALNILHDRHALALEAQQGSLDQFTGLKNAVQRDVGNLPTEQDPYIAARLANGGTSSVMRALMLHGQAKWAANGQHLEKIDGTTGLLDILSPLGDDINDWFGWMIGNRAARLAKEGRERNFTGADIAALQSLATPEKIRKFQKAAVEYAAFKRSVLDVAQEAGLINPESRKAWDYADYIPFYRQVDERSTFSPTGRKGLAGQSSGIRTLRGSESALNDPMENLLMNFSRLIDASLKNNALRKTIDTLTAANSDAVHKIGYDMTAEVIPAKQIEKRLLDAGTPQQILDVIPPEAFDGMAKMWAIQAPTDPDVVRVMRDGKPQFYRVEDPLLLRSLTSFVPFDFPGLGMMRWFKRLLTGTVTAAPDFVARNFIRDSVASQMITRDGFHPGKSFSGIARSLKETGGFETMLFAGASFQSGNINAADPTGTARAMRRALRDKGLSGASADQFLSTVIDSPVKFWEKWRHFSEAIENANREAVFEAATKAGKSPTAASFEAKDLMDFNLRGSWAAYQLLADVVPFLNARVQGLYRLGRTDPKRLMVVGLMLMAASLALGLANAGRDDYEALPDWDKDTYWHFWINGEHFRIPKPFELGVAFATLPERVMRYAMGLDTGAKLGKRAWANVRDQLAFDPVPQMIRPALNVWANKDTFRDAPIENQADEGKPPHLRYSPSTSEATREALNLTAPLTDKLGLSPKRLEYLINAYTGAAGFYTLATADLAIRRLTDAPPEPAMRADDLPIVKSFYRVDPARSTVWESDLYTMREAVDEIYRGVEALKREGALDKAQAGEEANLAKLQARKVLDSAASRLKLLNKQRDSIYGDKTMSPDEKRQRLDELAKVRAQIARSAVEHPSVLEAF